LFQAHGFWAAGDAPPRWALEARLLTREPLETIAAKSGLATEVVEAYEALFFQVRDHLQARDYILLQVIGPRAARGPRSYELDVLWKLLAYHGGPLLLDVMLSPIPPLDLVAPEAGSDVDTAVDEMIRGSLWQKLLVAVTTLQLTSRNQVDVFRLYLRCVRLENRRARHQTNRNSLPAEVHIKAYLEQFPPEVLESSGGQAWRAAHEAATAAARGLAASAAGLPAGSTAPQTDIKPSTRRARRVGARRGDPNPAPARRPASRRSVRSRRACSASADRGNPQPSPVPTRPSR
jgi:hypothetical protein